MDRMIAPGPLQGRIPAIPAKSCAHRALICAALSRTPTELILSGSSQDIQATIHCLTALGARITPTPEGLRVEPIRQAPAAPVLDCVESGSTLRFLLPVAAALTENARFLGEGRLPQRPLGPLLEQLAAHGAEASSPTLPLSITHWRQGGCFHLPGDVSSQFTSGLLLAAPLLQEPLEVRFTTPPESLDYVEITRHVQARFGVAVAHTDAGYRVSAGQYYRSPGCMEIEGDWSNAAFWLVAGALSGQGITLTGLDPVSPQGDRRILDLLRQMGAVLTWQEGTLTAKPNGRLQGIQIDAAQIPDLVPILAVAAALAEGRSRIYHAGRLRLKESDRLTTTVQLIQDLGGKAQAEGDEIHITGVERLAGGETCSHNDHRIAMAAAIAATACQEPVRLRDSQAVAKSYPHFWEDFQRLGGRSHVL